MNPLPCERIPAAALVMALVLSVAWVQPASAQFPQWSTFPLQYVDARVMPRGQLRVGFLPSYGHYDTRFDSTGALQPLGASFSSDSGEGAFLPTLSQAEAAVRRIASDSTYRMNLGKVRLPLDADVRRFPFDFSLGLTDWLTLTVRVPLVKTRIQGTLSVDGTGANVGLNLAGTDSGAAKIQPVLIDLQAAIAVLQRNIDQGSYGCPISPDCQSKKQLLAEAQALLSDLTALAGPPGGPVPPVAPLSTSPAGIAIRTKLEQVASQLQGAGAGAVPTTYSLPATALDTGAVQAIVTDSAFGYDMLRLVTPRRTYTLGDVEASLRIGLLRGARLRAALSASARLPTGQRADPRHGFNLGTGDRQLDLEGGVEFAWEPGPLGLSGTAIYTHQFADQLEMRWATPEQPIAPIAYLYTTDRQLGDVFRAAAYPSLRLSEGFLVYGSVYYYHKAADSYSLPATADPVPGTPAAAEVARGSGGQALSIGGGIAYRATRPQRDTTGTKTALPVEAGLSYQAAYSGSGGLVPQSTMLNLYLRVYYRLWGKAGGG
jgi:hypothetical protein